MKDIEFHTLINSVTEVVYVVSMHSLWLTRIRIDVDLKRRFSHTRGTECACAQ